MVLASSLPSLTQLSIDDKYRDFLNFEEYSDESASSRTLREIINASDHIYFLELHGFLSFHPKFTSILESFAANLRSLSLIYCTQEVAIKILSHCTSLSHLTIKATYSDFKECLLAISDKARLKIISIDLAEGVAILSTFDNSFFSLKSLSQLQNFYLHEPFRLLIPEVRQAEETRLYRIFNERGIKLNLQSEIQVFKFEANFEQQMYNLKQMELDAVR